VYVVDHKAVKGGNAPGGVLKAILAGMIDLLVKE
jgi:hypothetical protein